MTYEQLLYAIEQCIKSYENNDYDETYDYDYDYNEYINIAKGNFLYTSKTIISKIIDYLYDNIEFEEDEEIEKNDLLLHLEIENIFKNNYTMLNKDIDDVIAKADYGKHYYFLEDNNEKFKELEKEILELYDEFKNIY